MTAYTLAAVVLLVIVALIFDFTNGFHDAANSIATIVATNTLSPAQAVVLAAFCNFVAMWVFDWKIAATIGRGVVDSSVVDLYVIFGCLCGAIFWNIVTWYVGMPTSSSHAIIGGLVGATIAKAGPDAVISDGVMKIAAFIVVSPVLGFILAAGLSTAIKIAVPVTARTDRYMRWAQVLSSAAYSLGHGTNDAQKTAGIIFLILVASSYLAPTDSIPYWVVFSSFAVMGLGTLAGGWRIVATMGHKLTKLTPRGGVAAELGGSTMLFTASALGVPISTTHTIAGAIVGVGGAARDPDINWSTVKNMLIAWVVTIPASLVLGAAFWVFAKTIAGHL